MRYWKSKKGDNTELADRKKDLLEISRLEPDEQKYVIEKVLNSVKNNKSFVFFFLCKMYFHFDRKITN
jgi:hypothetical protein